MSSSLSSGEAKAKALTPESKVVAVGQSFVVLVVVFPFAQAEVIGASLAQPELVASWVSLVLWKR